MESPFIEIGNLYLPIDNIAYVEIMDSSARIMLREVASPGRTEIVVENADDREKLLIWLKSTRRWLTESGYRPTRSTT